VICGLNKLLLNKKTDMTIAVIDCGTNTFNLLIKNTYTGEVFYNDKIAVRIGQGGLEENLINPDAWQRGIEALQAHRQTILNLVGYTASVYVMATSAVRSASNGAAFVAAAYAEVGLTINVITGQQEADLIYLGVKQGIALTESATLIMDIGGGSTELILLKGEIIHFKESYQVGSSRLLEKFRPADPILPEELEAINAHLEETFSDLLEACKVHQPRILIGSSGSFDTIAQMCAANFKTTNFDAASTNYTFKMHEYMQIAQKMIAATYEERLNTPGMIAMRADLIVMAHLQINLLIKRLGIKTLQQCNYALKEGLFLSLNSIYSPWQKSLL
jgi:exopolyphosphatase/guanosine-5'-triphosphate,3'-diphosphate pyrophosphatase